MPTRGFTLVEMVVVIAILGLVAVLSTVAIGSLRAVPQSAQELELEHTRQQALQTGLPTGTEIEDSSGRRPAQPVLFLPDGRALGSGLDPWTGGASEHSGDHAP
jgi:prepilin-type N-terminal cleavage/methylation domain-containing protein